VEIAQIEETALPIQAAAVVALRKSQAREAALVVQV
jgi:hypothetical protein